MDRREALRRVSLMLGGTALVSGSSLLAACEEGARPVPAPDGSVGDFSAEQVALLDEIAETILPETDTPGAKAARVGAFIALMVTDVYDPDDQDVFRDGMAALNGRASDAFGAGFSFITPHQRLELVTELDRERFEHQGDGPHYFELMKQLALLGYFTSEIGCTVAQQYVESPGRFDPCVPYESGERSWARHA